MCSFSRELKLWYFTNRDEEKQKQVFRNIKYVEENIHSSPAETYSCVLECHGGDAATTERISCLEGTFTDGLKSKVQGCVPCRIQWHKLNIMFTFIGLCSHIFDYIKDIGQHFNHLTCALSSLVYAPTYHYYKVEDKGRD